MNNFILGVIFLVLALGGIVVRKTYYHLPARELKRQAEKKDPVAEQLYRAVAYGNSLRGLLWLYIGLMSALSLVLLARVLPIWLSLAIVAPLLWVAFSLLPASRSTRIGTRVTLAVTPLVAWLLNYMHPVLSRGADIVERRYTIGDHTLLFERNDLLELIERQQRQADNRLSLEELEIAKRALSFDDYKVSDILTPRSEVKTVQADDTIGPILIHELHQGDQEYVLVREHANGPFVGMLRTSRLGIKSSGHIRNIMEPTVYYVHENDVLTQALHAFFITNHPLFVVVNSFEEYVGIITVENILQHLLGHIPGDDFDQYADVAAVAARHPKKSRKSKPVEETSVKTDDEVLE